MPGTVLGAEVKRVNKTDKNLYSSGAYVLIWETDNKA